MHCLLEINRIMKPQGFFLLTTPNCASWYSIRCALNQHHPSRYAHYSKDGRAKNAIHAREYLAAEVYALFIAAGFGVNYIDTFDYDPEPRWQPIPGYSTEFRGETIICVGRKLGQHRLRFTKECYAGVDVPFSEAIRYKALI